MKKQVNLSSVQELCDKIQPGDMLGFHLRNEYGWFINLIISSLGESYVHHVIVLENKGVKYVYHAYPMYVQRDRIRVGDSTEDHILTQILGWAILLEPLDSYLTYMNKSDMGVRVYRSGIPLSYSSEIHHSVVQTLTDKTILTLHCCIVLGEYLKKLRIFKSSTLPHYLTHTLVYTPTGIETIYQTREEFYYQIQ